MADIIDWSGLTTCEIDPDAVLRAACGMLKTAIVIGYQHDGSLYLAGSNADFADMLWLMEQAKAFALETDMARRERGAE